MKNNIEFIVKEPTKLLKYLYSNILNKSKNNIKNLLSRGNVIVDNKVITQFDYLLKTNQKVNIKKNISNSIDIIYEDKEIIVINKKSGLLSISTEKEKIKTAYHQVINYEKNKNKKNKIFVVHRLDKDTSGVLIFAKNENTKHLLQNSWNNNVIKRSYIAIVDGKVLEEEKTIKSYLKENKENIVYSCKEKDGKEAITYFKKIKSNNKYTMLNLILKTGRKNQIRVHLNDLNYSIIGDKKYGCKTDPIKRLGLHANILELKHPITNKLMRFEAKIPDEFTKLIK